MQETRLLRHAGWDIGCNANVQMILACAELLVLIACVFKLPMCTSNKSPPRLPLSKHEFTIDRCQRQQQYWNIGRQTKPLSHAKFTHPHQPNSIRIECIPSANLNRIRYFIKIVRKVSNGYAQRHRHRIALERTTTRKTISRMHIDPEMGWN